MINIISCKIKRIILHQKISNRVFRRRRDYQSNSEITIQNTTHKSNYKMEVTSDVNGMYEYTNKQASSIITCSALYQQNDGCYVPHGRFVDEY